MILGKLFGQLFSKFPHILFKDHNKPLFGSTPSPLTSICRQIKVYTPLNFATQLFSPLCDWQTRLPNYYPWWAQNVAVCGRRATASHSLSVAAFPPEVGSQTATSPTAAVPQNHSRLRKGGVAITDAKICSTLPPILACWWIW